MSFKLIYIHDIKFSSYKIYTMKNRFPSYSYFLATQIPDQLAITSIFILVIFAFCQNDTVLHTTISQR